MTSTKPSTSGSGSRSASAAPSSSGLYSSIDPIRIVDTRVPVGFGRLAASRPATVAVPGGASRSAVVQNITVTGPSAAGWAAAHPTPAASEISNVNFTAPGQTRAVLAFTELTSSGQTRFTSLVSTDLVADVVNDGV